MSYVLKQAIQCQVLHNVASIRLVITWSLTSYVMSYESVRCWTQRNVYFVAYNVAYGVRLDMYDAVVLIYDECKVKSQKTFRRILQYYDAKI